MFSIHAQRLFVALALIASPQLFAADEPTPKSDRSKPVIAAQFSDEASSEGYRPLHIYSKEELTLVEYKFYAVEGWGTMSVGKPPKDFGYLTTSYLPTKDTQKFLVRGIRKDGTRFTNLLTVSNDGKMPTIQVAGYSEESKEAVVEDLKKKGTTTAAAAAAVGGNFALSDTEREMIEAANAYRAKHGRAALQVSPELMAAARAYAASGAYSHPTANAYAARSGFPGRTTENLARGNMTGARVIQFWGEPGVGHEHQLAGLINVNRQWVEGGFTHVGVAGVNGNWIIYFGSAR